MDVAWADESRVDVSCFDESSDDVPVMDDSRADVARSADSVRDSPGADDERADVSGVGGCSGVGDRLADVQGWMMRGRMFQGGW